MTDKQQPTSPPPIEQISEFRNSTRRAGEAAPPRAAQFGKGARNLDEIREATEARRRQSASWTNRDIGPRTGNHDFNNSKKD